MKLILSYLKLYCLITVRNPPAFFFTLIFPPLLLILTSHQWGPTRSDQIQAFIIYLNYSVQTVSFMLLGMGVSQEKNSEWAKYVRTLPTSVSTMVVGRMLHTLSLCCVNIMTIMLVATFILSIPVTIMEFSYLFVIALFGAIPMSLIGMTIGYAANPESSRSIFTLINLLLLFGSFSLPSQGVLSYLSLAVPTYQWSVISAHIIEPQISLTTPLTCLGLYIVVFAFLFRKVYEGSKKV